MEYKNSRSESNLNDEMVLLADIKEEDVVEDYKQDDDEQFSKEIDIKAADIIINIKLRSKDRHKTIECSTCLRKMKSQNLKRHMKTHRDIHHLEDNELRNEIKRRKKIHEINKERIQYVK